MKSVPARPVSRIESAANPRFREWKRWVADPADVTCPWLPLEGVRQIGGLARHLRIQLLVGSSSALNESRAACERARQVVEVPERLMKSLSGVRAPQGVVAFLDKPRWDWPHLTPWLIYLDGVQDPGNLGTIFRTAAAAGDFSVVTAPGTVSCFNAKVVRASAGYLFEVPFREGVEASGLVENGYRLCVTDPSVGPSLFEAELNPPMAFAFGSEGSGVSHSTLELTGERLRIPMSQGTESLNVSISTALVMYEVRRRGGR